MRRVKGDDFKQMGERKAIERGRVCVCGRERERNKEKEKIERLCVRERSNERVAGTEAEMERQTDR